MKVLVADEDVTNRNFVLKTLEDPELQVVCAFDGVQAWELLSRMNPPRLAVLDWVLPNMGSLDICRKLRERAASHYTYVVVLGARPDKADLVAAFQAGADAYIRKPIDPEELVTCVETGKRMLAREQKLTNIITGWRTMLDGLPFGVACMGSRGQLMRANKVFLQMLGYDVGDLLGKTPGQTVLRNSSQVSHLMDCIRRTQAFDGVATEMMGQDGKRNNLIVWGRPIAHEDMVYQIITGLP